jgi:esterase/lipase
VIDGPKILGKTNALAILSGSSFPVKKLAKYLNKNGFTLYSESLLALSQAPFM